MKPGTVFRKVAAKMESFLFVIEVLAVLAFAYSGVIEALTLLYFKCGR
jgi:hypothetical protein